MPSSGSLDKILSKFSFQIGGLTFAPNLLQAVAIVFLLFLLVLTMANVRRHFLDWSFKGAAFGVLSGFLLAIVLEGFLIIGGRTALTEVLGWKNAPKPLSNALDAGRSKLVDVLGVTKEIPETKAREDYSSEQVVDIYKSLPQDVSKDVRLQICK